LLQTPIWTWGHFGRKDNGSSVLYSAIASQYVGLPIRTVLCFEAFRLMTSKGLRGARLIWLMTTPLMFRGQLLDCEQKKHGRDWFTQVLHCFAGTTNFQYVVPLFLVVSTDDQTLDSQIDALKGAGAERIFQEKKTGKNRNREELKKLLEHLRDSDVIIVTKYDRLARSLRDLIDIVEAIRERGAGFRSLGEDIDTTTSTGRLIFHVFGSIAEFERERIVERTKEGLEAARRRGRVGGRPSALNKDQKDEVRRMRDEEKRPVAEIARIFGVSRQTIVRA
jgi:DNA invertase Pin-like site-specific DNA recombinase